MLPLALAVLAGSLKTHRRNKRREKPKQLAWRPAGILGGKGRELLAQWAGSGSGPHAQCGHRDFPFSLLSSAQCPGLWSPPHQCLGEHGGQWCATGHAVLAWEPAIIERVHVDDGVSLDHHGRLWLVLDPTLAGEGETDLVGHGAAEGALEQGVEGKGAPGEACPAPVASSLLLPSLC